jgi:general secretion pathway protein C
MRRAILPLLILTSGCDQGLRQEVAVLREEVANHEATIKLLHRRVEDLANELEQERAARRAGDEAREVPPPPLVSEPIEPGITPQCEMGRCTVSRAELDKVLESPAQLARGARVVPLMKDGQAIGFKVYGIRPGSLYGAIGLKNGDLVQEIAGKPLTSADAALEAYAAAKKAERMVIKGSRKDEPFEIVLEVRADAPEKK